MERIRCANGGKRVPNGSRFVEEPSRRESLVARFAMMASRATEPRAVGPSLRSRVSKNIAAFSRRICVGVLATLISALGTSALADAQYYYDELGRLIQAVAGDGSSVQYSYDAVGNVTAVRYKSAAAIGISGFMPISGPVGTTVTIYGSGFSTTPSSNVVQFNGTSANVSSATATSLIVTVPAGATTGPITVGTSPSVATSSTNFTVAALAAPTLTGFSPTIAAQGATVTLTGTNFQSALETNKVLFGSMPTPAASATPTTLATAVPTQASS